MLLLLLLIFCSSHSSACTFKRIHQQQTYNLYVKRKGDFSIEENWKFCNWNLDVQLSISNTHSVRDVDRRIIPIHKYQTDRKIKCMLLAATSPTFIQHYRCFAPSKQIYQWCVYMCFVCYFIVCLYFFPPFSAWSKKKKQRDEKNNKNHLCMCYSTFT